MGSPLVLDTRVRCGMVVGAGAREPVIALARRCEAHGFDSLWVGDHISFTVPILDPLSVLSLLAGVTERVQLGTSVYLLPLRHPTLTAKTVASVDVLSGGRLILGVGVGGEFPREFEAVGVPVNERGSRADESIGLIRRLWSEEGVAHEGRHFRFGAVSLNPKPIQAGGPPIWVGGRRAPAFRRAGRLGDGYISHMASPEMIADNLAVIARHAEDAGREPRPFATAAFLFTVLDDDYDAAHDRAAKMLGAIYNRDFRDAAGKYVLLGRPADCLEQMRRFANAGIRHFILSPLSDPLDFADRVAADILPRLGELGG